MSIHRLHNLRLGLDEISAEMAEQRPRFQALADRHENGTAPRVVSSFNLFPTPDSLAKRLVALLALSGRERVLEPSAGFGSLLRHIPETCETVAVEIAPECAGELFRGFPDARLLQRDFLTVHPAELGAFDAVAMNPPFHMRADLRHVEHALEFLKPGGLLAGICMAGPKRETALRDRAETWETLKPGTFPGTRVETILFTLRA